MLTPSIFFLYDREKIGVVKKCILDSIQKDTLNADIFQDILIRCIEKKDNINSGRNNSSSNDNIHDLNNRNEFNNFNNTEYNEFLNPNENTGFIGNAEILEQQRREMEEVLRKEELAEREKKKKLEEEVKKKKEVKKNLNNDN